VGFSANTLHPVVGFLLHKEPTLHQNENPS